MKTAPGELLSVLTLFRWSHWNVEPFFFLLRPWLWKEQLWLHQPSLWTWPWKEQVGLFAWHSGSWWCTFCLQKLHRLNKYWTSRHWNDEPLLWPWLWKQQPSLSSSTPSPRSQAHNNFVKGGIIIMRNWEGKKTKKKKTNMKNLNTVATFRKTLDLLALVSVTNLFNDYMHGLTLRYVGDRFRSKWL